MPLVHRLARLFRADLHAVLDRIEEPQLLLAQSIREMEAALRATTQRVESLGRQCEELGRRRQAVEEQLAGIASQLDLCLDAGNGDLARMLLRRRLEGERLLLQIARRGTELGAERERTQVEAASQREQLEELQHRAAVHQRCDEADGVAPSWSSVDPPVSDADVELALLREQRRRS